MRYLNNIFLLFIICFITGFYSPLLPQNKQVEKGLRYKQASAYYRSGAYERAIPLFNKLLKENPRHRGSFEKLVQVYLKIRYADSVEVLTNRFSKNNRLLFKDYMSVAASRIIKSQKKEALLLIDSKITELHKSKKLKPNDIQKAALMLQRYRLSDEALSYYEKGINLFPNAAYFYLSIADIHKQQMKNSAAVEAYLKYLIKKPDGFKTISSRIMSIKITPGQKDEIGKIFQRFIKGNPKNKYLIELLIEFQIRNRDYKSALQLVEKKLLQDHKLPQILKIASEMGNSNESGEAIALLEKYDKNITDENSYRIKLHLIKLYALQFRETQLTAWLEKIDFLLNEVKDKGNRAFWDLKFQQLHILLKNRYDVDNCIQLAGDLLKNTKNNGQKAQLYMYLGNAYRLKNNLKKSSNYYSLAVKQKKHKQFAQFELIMNDFYTFKWDSLDVEIGRGFSKLNLQDTISNNYLQLKQYLNLNFPDNESRKLFALALLKQEQGALSESYEIFTELIDTSEGYFKNYCSIVCGNIANKIGMQKEAIDIYQTMIADSVLVERHEDAMFFLAEILVEIPEKKEEAGELYFKILDKYPAGRYADKIRKKIKQMQEDQTED